MWGALASSADATVDIDHMESSDVPD